MNFLLSLLLLLGQGTQAPQGFPPQQSQPPPQAMKPADLCTIEGTVLKAGDGRPLKKARVTIRKAEGRSQPSSATTEADGKFTLRDVQPGRYRLFVDRNGYARQEYGQRSANRPGSIVTLNAGQKMRDVLFRMTPAAVIAGRVFDEDGEPVVQTAVQAMRNSYVRGQRQLTPAGSASTNDRGEFRIFGLPAGRYYLSATPTPGMAIFGGGPGGGGGGGGGTFVMIAGDGPGGGGGQEESYAATYYPGTIDPARASQIDVKGGDEALGMDMTLILQKTYRIRGRVANSIETRSRAETSIFLMPRDPGARSFMPFRNRATVNEAGQFEIRGVAPGSYYVNAMMFTDEQPFTARQAVDVGQADLEDVNILISPGADIAGKVKLDGNVDLSSSNVNVMLAAPDEGLSFNGMPGSVATDGTFTLRSVSPGSYTIRVMGMPPDAYIKEARFASDDVLEGQMNVAAGRASGTLEITLSGNGGRVEGMVLNDESLAFSGAQVVLVPEERLRGKAELFKTGTTDQLGKFTLRGVRPGEYKLFAWDDVEPGSWHDPDFLRTNEKKGVSVKISEGATQTTDLKVLSGN